MGQRVFVSDAARKILAARDDKNCACDVLPKEVDPEETLPTLDAFRRSMRDAMRSGKSFARAIRRSVRDQMGAGGPSTGGSPEKTPGPGYEGIQTAPEYQPNALGNITAFSRASKTERSLDLGQTWGTPQGCSTLSSWAG